MFYQGRRDGEHEVIIHSCKEMSLQMTFSKESEEIAMGKYSDKYTRELLSGITT